MAEGIAILAWGSLLWDDDPALTPFNEQRGEWQYDDGPELPLEFSRISLKTRKGALTLVIDPAHGARCQVAYSLSKRQSVEAAIDDLAKREGANSRFIGSWQVSSAECATNKSAEYLRIQEWARAKNLLAVVWTALESNFEEERRTPFNAQNAVGYLRTLSQAGRLKAKEYVERAPSFVKVPTRAALLAELGRPIDAVADSGDHQVSGVTDGSEAATTEARGTDIERPGQDERVMDLSDYQSKYFSIYEAFASTVRFILEQALQAAEGLPRPQSIQSRAKRVESLRLRLTEIGKLDTQMLERDRRDLAGVRLIFYTNNDVERFLGSALIRENFEIEPDSTKIHHPTPEKDDSRYRAVHFTVRLRADRTRLPEYQRFAGMRCEIQVQTILNHAWAETSHDILYKTKLGEGYGGRAMKGITRRFERIMDDYLIPAGYEIQKAQQEYERLVQGKELFDKDVASALDAAQNNNERYEILSKLKDYAIPNYDDIPATYDGLKGPLLRAVKAAREVGPVSIDTAFGSMPGFKADLVTKLVVEIVVYLRYADPAGSLQLLIDIYRNEKDQRIQEQIVNAVRHLAEYNLSAYERAGPMLQMALVDHLDSMSGAEVDSVRPLALVVWKEALDSEITGTKWTADSVVIRNGAVPVSEELDKVRDKAIRALFSAFDRSTDDTQRRGVLAALNAATRTPYQGNYPNELLAATVRDAVRIVDFVRERVQSTSFALLQHMEHGFLFDYSRAIQLAEDKENRFECQKEARALMESIVAFRDSVNADEQFVKYKVLVGFDGADEYRRAEAARYIEEINSANQANWFALIERCARTKSIDGATFMIFGHFIGMLAERKPDVAEMLLATASDELRGFLPAFLTGLNRSARQDIYERVLESELVSARSLEGLALHLRALDGKNAASISRVLKSARDVGNTRAVSECLLFAIEHYGTDKLLDADALVRDALAYLSDRKEPRWVSGAWFRQKATGFYEKVTLERINQLLENLGYLRKVDFQVEDLLAHLAERWPEAVWDYFGDRLAREEESGDGENPFEAVPFKFHELHKQLSKDPQLAIRKGSAWFARDRQLFQFKGGRLLSNAFPNCSPEFATALADLVKGGGETEADFALAVLENYHGEASTHVVLKEIVANFSENPRKMSAVKVSVDSTGVVSGELGFAEAYRARKGLLAEWLKDERPAVKAFAEKHISELNRMIVSEHRRAEAEKEMWNREFEEGDDDSG